MICAIGKKVREKKCLCEIITGMQHKRWQPSSYHCLEKIRSQRSHLKVFNAVHAHVLVVTFFGPFNLKYTKN